jgi:hypothetical protein
MGNRGGATLALIVAIAAAACGGGNAGQRVSSAPEHEPGDQTNDQHLIDRPAAKCVSPTKPLVVDWLSTARGELEAIVEEHRTVAVVAYEGCTMRVLSECAGPGKVAYVSYRSTKQDKLRITNADDLYANLPVGAASLEAILQRSGELDVDMTLVGQYESDATSVAQSDLMGRCAGATHIVKTVTVGAFDFHAGAASSATPESIRRDGKIDACDAAKVDDLEAPQNCASLVRLEVIPILGPPTVRESR